MLYQLAHCRDKKKQVIADMTNKVKQSAHFDHYGNAIILAIM